MNDDDNLLDDGFPTVASAVLVFDHDSLLLLPSFEQMQARHCANEALTAAHEARCRKDRQLKETPLEIWKRVSVAKKAKELKAIKATAKKWVKQKNISKITSHFSKK